MMQKKIRVLIVEDSAVVRGLLCHILESDPEIEVTGTANNGEAALAFLADHSVDVVTMDIHMPGMSGFETTRQIMENRPVPIVIVSASWNAEEVGKTFLAMECGALTLLEKPLGPGNPNFEAMAREMVRTVKAMSEVKVVRRWRTGQRLAAGVGRSSRPLSAQSRIDLVAIGASTGGPMALKTILSALPADLDAPILIVQHIAMGFLPGMLEWLSHSTELPLHIARDSESLRSGQVYVAPDGVEMGVTRAGRVLLSDQEPTDGLRPSVAHLFRSVAEHYGPRAVGVLLTGMGRDGAQELKLIRDRRGVTIAQDEASSVVFGMPGEAVRLGSAEHVLPLTEIAAMLVQLTGRKGRTP